MKNLEKRPATQWKKALTAAELESVVGGGPVRKTLKKAKKVAVQFPDVSTTPAPGGPVPITNPLR